MNENHSHEARDDHHASDAPDALAIMLDLDASLLGAYLREVPAWAASYAGSPRQVLDLGAGTGVGSLALARAFPQAHVTALDADPEMLERVSTAAAAAGLDDRVSTRVVDLDEPWPADLTDLDLVWASSSLHHVSDPDRLLGNLASALSPTGVLVLVEMDHFPHLLPDADLERRLAQAALAATAEHGMDPFPDWGPHLTGAGLDVLDLRCFTQETEPGQDGAATFAVAYLTHLRTAMAERLDPADLAEVDRLLATGGGGDGAVGLAQRDDLVARGSRTAWVARARVEAAAR